MVVIGSPRVIIVHVGRSCLRRQMDSAEKITENISFTMCVDGPVFVPCQ